MQLQISVIHNIRSSHVSSR